MHAVEPRGRCVTAAEITRNFGAWQDRVAEGPLVITHHGRPRCVLLAAEQYEVLKGTDHSRSGPERDALIECSLLVERLGTGFIALDGNLRVVRLNTRAALTLAKPIEAALGHDIAELMPRMEGTPAAVRLRRTLRSREEDHVTIPVDGETEIRLHMFPWPNGVAMLISSCAISDDAEAIMVAAFESAVGHHGGIGRARLTVRGTIASASEALAKMVGFDPLRLAGVRAVDLVSRRTRIAFGEALEAIFTGSDPTAMDGELLAGGSEETPARFSFAALKAGFAITGAEMIVTLQPPARG